MTCRSQWEEFVVCVGVNVESVSDLVRRWKLRLMDTKTNMSCLRTRTQLCTTCETNTVTPDYLQSSLAEIVPHTKTIAIPPSSVSYFVSHREALDYVCATALGRTTATTTALHFRDRDPQKPLISKVEWCALLSLISKTIGDVIVPHSPSIAAVTTIVTTIQCDKETKTMLDDLEPFLQRGFDTAYHLTLFANLTPRDQKRGTHKDKLNAILKQLQMHKNTTAEEFRKKGLCIIPNNRFCIGVPINTTHIQNLDNIVLFNWNDKEFSSDLYLGI